MKKCFLKLFLILSCSAIMVSCAKDPDEPATEEPVDKGSFSWQLGSATAVTADSAHFYPQITTIYAFKNGNNNSIEMNLSALSAGNYVFSSTTGNTFIFVTNGSTYNASSGNCNISASGNNKLSGSFNVSFAGTTLGTLSGSFNNILAK